MTRYEPRPERPPPRRDASGIVAGLALLVLAAALLSDCPAKAQPAPGHVIVPAEFVVMVLPPPAELRCPDRGTWLQRPSGDLILAHSFAAHPVQLWIEYVPASPVCVFADGIEDPT